jgi:predicted AlkP superfamily pyrophosphatase or phosphodiesterase
MKNIFLLVLIMTCFASFSQNKPISTPAKPKLIVGIVVDQMRWDYLYRYAEKYGLTGFKRLQTGYNCENTHIPYVPSYTAPGHTCIYTGSVPALHGIVGNDWYDRDKHRRVYCAEDSTCHTVGATGDAGQMSPRNMLTTTVTDELRIASNFHSKVIGIAIKDRSALLPAGHAANGAYWFDGKSGNWISSSYYADSLPQWVNTFNSQKIPVKYLKDNWNTIQNISAYTESSEDDNAYEKTFSKESKPTFPHKVSEMTEKNVDVIKSTPWGNTLTFDFAKSAIDGEKFGKGSYTDFLTISFSSTDYIGHQFGPNSVEVEDCYIRFDKDLGDFLSYLDKEIGAGNYLVFLTADHGAAHANGFSAEHHIPGGDMPDADLISQVNKQFKSLWNIDSMVENFDNMQFYLKQRYGNDQLVDMKIANDIIAHTLKADVRNSVKYAIDLRTINTETLPSTIKDPILNGYNPKRSGDIQIVYEPAVLEDRAKGTTHGSLYNYDTHIPLLWYGWGVKAGHDYSQTYMTDIAATLSALLHIQEPNGSIGRPIVDLLKK